MERIPGGKDDITGPEIGPSTGQEIPDQAPSGKEFSPLMEQAGETGVQPEAEGVAPSPLAGQGPGEAVTPQTLQGGLNQLNEKAGQLQGIVTPERFDEMTAGQKSLLHTKLGQFTEHVKGLAEQTGTPTDLETPPKGSAVQGLETYVGWITNGQATIQNVANEIGSKGPGQMSVADMMRAQAKMQAADRAINFATAVAGRGTDFIKQIMQTQI